jgi:hypothetical protein
MLPVAASSCYFHVTALMWYWKSQRNWRPFCWHYSPRWALASSKIVLHSSRSRDSRIQFHTAKFFKSSSTDSRHTTWGFLYVECLLVYVVSFLHSSFILQPCPRHLNFTAYSPHKFHVFRDNLVGRESSVGIATRYWLHVPWDQIPVRATFTVPVQTGPGAHPASYTTGTGSPSRG